MQSQLNKIVAYANDITSDLTVKHIEIKKKKMGSRDEMETNDASNQRYITLLCTYLQDE